jgi:hypothetical protein
MPDSFKIRVWGVLGEASTGKTAIIGNLVSRLGRGPGGFRPVPLRGGGYLQIYARRQSLQEAKRSPEQVVRDTVKVARGLQRKHSISICYLNLLVAIRTDAIHGLPPASAYLSYFVKSGWSLESLVILDYEERKHEKYYAFGAPICEHYFASEMVRNGSQHHWLVGLVRNHFGWA